MILLNPLPTALDAYCKAMSEDFAIALGESPRLVVYEAEGIATPGKKLMVASSWRALRSGIVAEGLTICVWPLLGYLDTLQFRHRSRLVVVVHDPIPMGWQPASSARWGRMAAGLSRWAAGVELVAHSVEAADILSSYGFHEVRLLPHPIRMARPHRAQGVESSQIRVSVVGQYKPERDLGLLYQLARLLDARRFTLRIIGKGWPMVQGWQVRPAYLSDKELSGVIMASDVIVIPYSRFFQSGIAVRALEGGTHVVMRRTSFSMEVLGSDYNGLTDDMRASSWVQAIESLIGDSSLSGRRDRYQKIVAREYSAFVDSHDC